MLNRSLILTSKMATITTLTSKATEKPTINMPVKIKILNSKNNNNYFTEQNKKNHRKHKFSTANKVFNLIF